MSNWSWASFSSRTANFSSTSLRGTQALRSDLFTSNSSMTRNLHACIPRNLFFLDEKFHEISARASLSANQITYLSSRSRESNCNSANCKPPIAIARRVSNLLRNLALDFVLLNVRETLQKQPEAYPDLSLLAMLFLNSIQRGG